MLPEGRTAAHGMAFMWLTPTRPEETGMGRWIEDPRELPSGFRYIKDAEPLGQDPATTSLPTPHPRAVDYDEHRDYPVIPTALDLVDVPPRVDDWCEDRPPGELTDHDGTD